MRLIVAVALLTATVALRASADPLPLDHRALARATAGGATAVPSLAGLVVPSRPWASWTPGGVKRVVVRVVTITPGGVRVVRRRVVIRAGGGRVSVSSSVAVSAVSNRSSVVTHARSVASVR